MKANELRIGNSIRRMGVVVHIDGRTLFDLAYSESIRKEYEPIPLAEEWLIKFGFYFKKCGICGQDQWSGMDFYMNDIITLRGNLKNDSTLILSFLYDCQIKYVHQLQNLYFALIGEELTIKQ